MSKDELYLKSATIEDSEKIYKMQIIGFKALLEKYQDYDTNPGAETLEGVKKRFALDAVDQYFITLQDEDIGYIRIVHMGEGTYKLSQLFILPGYQNNGYAQAAIIQAELLYPDAKKWILDTIKQETKLCRLYEKLGYKLTGVEKNVKPGMDLVDYEK